MGAGAAVGVVWCGILLGQSPAPDVERRLHPAEITASTFLWNELNKFQENYHPHYVADDDPVTAWIEGAKGAGVGEEIRFVFSSLPQARALRLRVRNGYQKRKDLFRANAAVLKATVRLAPSQETFPVVLKDTMDWQDIALSFAPQSLSGLALRIDAVRKGTKYEDLCLSDVQIFVTSPAPENPKLEQKRFEALLSWKAERQAAAKLFAENAKKGLPFAAGYGLAERAENVDVDAGLHAALPKEIAEQREADTALVDLRIDLKRPESIPPLAALEFFQARIPDHIANEITPATTDEELCDERCESECEGDPKKACRKRCHKACLAELAEEARRTELDAEPRRLAMPNPPRVAVFNTAWLAAKESSDATPEQLRGHHEADEDSEFDVSGPACESEYAYRGVLHRESGKPPRLLRLQVHQCSDLEARAWRDVSIDVMELYYDRAGRLALVEWAAPRRATVLRWQQRADGSWMIQTAITFDGERAKKLVFKAAAEPAAAAAAEPSASDPSPAAAP